MKKKMTKGLVLALVGVLAVACLGLAACGGSGSNSSNSSSQKSEASYKPRLQAHGIPGGL